MQHMGSKFASEGWLRHEPHDRLRLARQKAGFDSAADAARALRVPYGTYSGHENGTRGLRVKEIERYSKAFNVTSNWMLFGHEWDESELRIAGVIRGHGDVVIKAENALDTPFSDGIRFRSLVLNAKFFKVHVDGYVVIGSYYSPIFEDGDVLIFKMLNVKESNDHIGQWCLCTSGMPPSVTWHFGKLAHNNTDSNYSLGVRGSYHLDGFRRPMSALYMVMPAAQVAIELQSGGNRARQELDRKTR